MIEQTRAFLESGAAPQRGIDDVDRLLMRKRYLMGKCGIAESHRLTEQGDVTRPSAKRDFEKAALSRVEGEEKAAAARQEELARAWREEAEEYGEEIDLDAEEEEEDNDDKLDDRDKAGDEFDDDLDDVDMMDDIDALLDEMVSGDSNSALDGSHGSSIDMSSAEGNEIIDLDGDKVLFVRGTKTDKLVLSAALMCAVRVSVMNETDVNLLCPNAKGAWDEHKCEDEIFTEYMPIDKDNERGMVSALRSSIHALLEAYPSTLEEDELLLQLSTFGPATRSAIVLRAREKDLLLRAFADLQDWENALDANQLSFQLAAIKKHREAKRKEQEQRQLIREQAIKEMQEMEHYNELMAMNGTGDGSKEGGPVLARIPCSDVFDANGAMLSDSACGDGGAFEVRRGRSLEDDLNVFKDKWGLSKSEAKQLGYQAMEVCSELIQFNMQYLCCLFADALLSEQWSCS